MTERDRRSRSARFVGMNHVDHASFDALAAWEEQHAARGGRVRLNWQDVELLCQRPNRPRKVDEAAAVASSIDDV